MASSVSLAQTGHGVRSAEFIPRILLRFQDTRNEFRAPTKNSHTANRPNPSFRRELLQRPSFGSRTNFAFVGLFSTYRMACARCFASRMSVSK